MCACWFYVVALVWFIRFDYFVFSDSGCLDLLDVCIYLLWFILFDAMRLMCLIWFDLFDLSNVFDLMYVWNVWFIRCDGFDLFDLFNLMSFVGVMLLFDLRCLIYVPLLICLIHLWCIHLVWVTWWISWYHVIH